MRITHGSGLNSNRTVRIMTMILMIMLIIIIIVVVAVVAIVAVVCERIEYSLPRQTSRSTVFPFFFCSSSYFYINTSYFCFLTMQSCSHQVLFGHGLWQDHFFQKVPTVSRHRLHKDFPEVGDCAYFAVEGIWIARPVKEFLHCYRVVLVFSTPEDIWASWASPFFPTFTDMFHRAMERVLNGPGFGDMRAVDKQFYIVLSMRSFNRGHPMVPQTNPSHDTVSISAGQHHGFTFWIRFHSGKFYLDEYLQCFLELLGYKLEIYRAMDGRELVPYQCVVVRQEWDQLRESFFAAFRVQKSAYRRANGGTSSPSLVEDAKPHWTGRVREVTHDIKTMVRNTFLECHDGPPGPEGVKRSNSTGRMMHSSA